MADLFKTTIAKEANKLARKYKIKDTVRIQKIFERYAVDCYGRPIPKNVDDRTLMKNGLAFYPSLEDVFTSISPQSAIALFAKNKPSVLLIRDAITSYLFDSNTPFYTLQELAGLLEKAITYLNDNEQSLIAKGRARESFKDSDWLNRRLARLYSVPYGSGSKENLIQLRENIFYRKLYVFKNLIHSILVSKNAKTLWQECSDILSKTISKDDRIRTYIDELESFGISSFIPSRPSGPYFKLGGLNDIFAIIAFVEEELTIGAFHNTKTRLLPYLPSESIHSYYQFGESPDLDKVDNILYDFFKYKEPVDNFINLCACRMDEVNWPELKVPPVFYEPFKEIIRNFINSQRERRPSVIKANVEPLTLPAGTKWQDITIEFINEYDVTIKVKGGDNIESNYQQMGFENENTKKPNMQWAWLRLLASCNGRSNHESIQKLAGSKNLTQEDIKDKKKSIKNTLSKILKHYFGINTDPFHRFQNDTDTTLLINLIDTQDSSHDSSEEISDEDKQFIEKQFEVFSNHGRTEKGLDEEDSSINPYNLFTPVR